MPSVRLSIILEPQLWKIPALNRSENVTLAGVSPHGLAEAQGTYHTSCIGKAEVQGMDTAVSISPQAKF